MAEPDLGRGADRLLTFLDAIVAIAITLLVLPLVELTQDVDSYASVGDLLRSNVSDIGAFALSFAVVSRLWFVQHDSARHLRRYDTRVAGLQMFWAASIVFLPFPTALVASASDDPATKVLYFGTLVAAISAMAVTEWFLCRHPELTDADPEGDLGPASGVTNAALTVVALGITLAAPSTSYFPLLLLLLAGPITRGVRRLG